MVVFGPKIALLQCAEAMMRKKLLLLLVRNGYEPLDAANIVGILLSDPYLGPLLSGDPAQFIDQGPFIQQLPEGVFYFSPSK